MTKPRVRVDQNGRILAIDGMANVVTGVGRANAKVAAARYIPEAPGGEDDAFRASTWYRKCVTIPAADAVREWRSWQADSQQIEAIEAEEKRLAVRQVAYQALLTARHTGGAVIIVGGLPGTQDQPLSLDRVQRGSVRYLHVLGRHDISPGEVIRNPESPWFGQPKNWTLTTESGSLELHPSRVVFINGRTVPGAQRRTGSVWGDSIWVQMADSIRAADGAAAIIDAMMQEAKIDVVKVSDFISQMAAGGSDEAHIARWTMAAQMKSVSNVLLLDGSDDWQQKQITWTGLPDVVRTLLMIMAGAADIPVTRLTGEQQTGLSGSDAGSLRHYYDSVKTMQELEYTPALAPLDEILIRSALGARPDEVWYQWRPLWQPDAKQLAEIDKIEAETASIYARDALVPSEALEKAVQNRMVESGRWPGLEQALDEVPEDADEDDTQVTGEEDDANTAA